MKKNILLITIFFLCNFSAQAQWSRYLTGQSSSITELSVLNDNVIWATDRLSNFFSISTDGGVSWQTKKFPSIITNDRNKFYSNGNICAVSTTTAFIVQSEGKNKGIYKTIDSGSTWTKQDTAFNSTSSYPDFVYLWNENEGVAVGDGFEIYTTINGGNQWNVVNTINLALSANSWTENFGAVFKILGNSIYFETNKGQILKSKDKGLTWTIIKTPLTSNRYMSFEFKDSDNGLLSDFNTNTNTSTLYTTTNGGLTWTILNSSTTNNYSQLKYLPSKNIYTNVCGALNRNHGGKGMSYSSDNGQTWIQHPSFQNLAIGQINETPSGKVIMGGDKYIFYSNNYKGENICLKDLKIVNSNSIDITFSKEPNMEICKDTSNYKINSISYKTYHALKINSIIQDQSNKNTVHLIMDNNLPEDTILVSVRNIYGNVKEFPILDDATQSLFNFETEKTITVYITGTLLNTLTTSNKKNLRKLIVKGGIDARDFVIMRDSIRSLTDIDLSSANIYSFTGTISLGVPGNSYYGFCPSNTIPMLAFAYSNYHINNTYYMTDGLKRLKTIILPKTCTNIGGGAFYKSGLTSIVFPSSVTDIENYSFSTCGSLKSVYISKNVSTIGKQAFIYCYNLDSLIFDSASKLTSIADSTFMYADIKSIDLPTSIISIGNSAFEWCNEIITVNLPESLTYLGQYAFRECYRLKSVVIPSSVKTMGQGAFHECSALTSVSLSNALTSIKNGAFYNCTNLISINIPSNVTSIEDFAFRGCSSLTSINLPIGLKSIGYGSFSRCIGFSKIDLPYSVTSIGNFAFNLCTNIKSIYAYPELPVNLIGSDSTFNKIDSKTCILYVPKGSKNLYQSAYLWKDFTNVFEMTTAVPSVLDQKVKLYPNQITDVFQISGLTETAFLQLIDINGRMVLAQKVNNNEPISVSSLPQGMYIVKLITAEGTAIRKVMKK